MKKITIFILCLVIVFGICSCRAVPVVSETDLTTKTTTTTAFLTTKKITTTKKLIPEYVPGSVKLNPDNDFCDEDAAYFKRHYRLAYYRIPSPLDELAGQAGYEFMEQITINANGNEINEMLMVSFVKKFKIPKEKFERVLNEIKEYYASIAIDTSDEQNELPNADIIYTFDNEIINEYYRRE